MKNLFSPPLKCTGWILFRLIRILQGCRLVKDGFLRRGVLVFHIVSGTLELDGDAGGVLQEGGFGVPGRHDQRIRIEEILVILVLRYLGHVGKGKEAVIVTDFQRTGMIRGDPMDRSLDGSPFAGLRMRGGIIGTLQRDNLSFSVLDHLVADDEVYQKIVIALK